MKLLLDQGLPRSTVQNLAIAGIAAEHVGDIAMARASDDAILESSSISCSGIHNAAGSFGIRIR